MPHSPSLPEGYENSSSLDPLADSFNGQTSPVATRRSSSPTKRRLSSPIKTSTRKRSSGDRKSIQSPQSVSIVAQSPSRTVTEQTLSPWKIRVTVETEPEDPDESNEMTPAATTTRTTKIPLRLGSSPTPTPAEQGSSRGRKSLPGTGKSTRRSGTPVRGKNNSRSRSRRQSVTDLDIVVLGDDGDSDEWTGRAKSKSPRKTRARSRGRAKSVSTEPEAAVKGARKEAAKFEIHQDEGDGISVHEGPEQLNSESPELRHLDLNMVSVRTRAPPTKQKEEPEQPLQVGLAQTAIQPSPKPPKSSSRKVSAASAASYPTPSPTSSYRGDSDEAEKNQDPTSQHAGFDTILESEEFTMIDLSSVPSAKLFLSTPPDSQDTESAAPSATGTGSVIPQQPTNLVKPSPIPRYMATLDEESELSSNVPSSPPAFDSSMLHVTRPSSSGLRKVTPVQYSSPKLPSPPRQTKKSPRGHQRTMSKEAVNAGIALQEIVSPEKVVSATPRYPTLPKISNLVEDDLYTGFSSGTKRELRAGLRFGEELAKRQKPVAPVSKSAMSDEQTKASTSTQVWRGEALVRHSSPLPPPTPLPASNAPMQTKIDMVNSPGMFNPAVSAMMRRSTSSRTKDLRSSTSSTENLKPHSHTETPKSSSHFIGSERLNTDARRQLEWQLEREAVSREIDDASPSKVIVIDSDDEGKSASLSRRPVAQKPSGSDKEEYGRKGAHQAEESLMESAPSPPRQTSSQAREEREESHNIRADGGEGAPGLAEEDFGEVGDGDIWLEEAKAGSSSPKEVTREDLFTRTEQQRQRERAAEVVNKPRRSLLPSPWKRGEDVEASTFMSNGETSGMIWQQPQSAGFGAGDIAQTKRALNSRGDFDFERMMSSPAKIARPGRKASMELRIDQLNRDLEDTGVEEEEEEEAEEDEHSQSWASERSMHMSPPQETRVPVKFNDSTLTHDTTPPPLARSTTIEDNAERPPTPRSALKGARQSFGVAPPQDSPRKVIFNQRSMYLNDNGEESTMSAKLDSPQVEEAHPLYDQHQELGEVNEVEEEAPKKSSSSWMGWLWKGKLDADDSSQHETTLSSEPPPQLDGNNDSISQEDEEEEQQQWQPTRTALSSGNAAAAHPELSQAKSKPKPKKRRSAADTLPSYLKPPSYPSDPTRSPTASLSTSGEFTNTHFRTLHIIYAKSQRPRFHPPASIRPAVRAMLGWKMELDLSRESEAGRGVAKGVIGEDEVFEWMAGEAELQVVERFMQEVEWSWVQAGDVKVVEEVKWGWDVEELVRHLGMVCVGEVVRREERRIDGRE